MNSQAKATSTLILSKILAAETENYLLNRLVLLTEYKYTWVTLLKDLKAQQNKIKKNLFPRDTETQNIYFMM